jgi:hypothetical protein
MMGLDITDIKIMTLDKQQYEQLKELIREHGLDADHFNYGNFMYKCKRESYHPEHRDKYPEYTNRISIGSLIYQLVDDHSVDLSDEDAKDFKIFIAEQMSQEKYTNNRDDRFNAYTYTYSIYINEMIGNKWYVTGNQYGNDVLEPLPFDCSDKRDMKLKEAVHAKAMKAVNHIMKTRGYEPKYRIEKKYLNKHYRTHDEFLELIWMAAELNFQGHPTHQLSRFTVERMSHRIEDFKEHTFKSTGRRVLLDIHQYGINYVAIDKIIL